MTESPSSAPVLRLRAPGDLLEAVPYLLGFHPTRSLVIIGLNGSSVVLTTRIDLAELRTGSRDEVGDHSDWPDDQILDETLQVISTSGSNAVIGVVYDDDADVSRPSHLGWRNAVRTLQVTAAHWRLDTVDALLVSRGRWWSYLCTAPGCCPPEGRELAGDTSPAAATATFAGLVALSDRAELERLLAPAPDRDRLYPRLAEFEQQALRARATATIATHQRSVKRAIFAAARTGDSLLFSPGPTGARLSQLARFGVGLQEIAVRDAVWIAVDHDRLDGRALWRDLAVHLPPPYAAAGLFLFGWAEWRTGNSVLARIAAEQALATDPDYTAAQLLLGAISHALDPRRTPRLRLPRSA